MPRYEYRLQLDRLPLELAEPPAGARRPIPEDREALAALMIDAYRGAIDDDGETLDDARAEIDGYFSGTDLAPLLEYSWVAGAETLDAACLVAHWPARNCALFAYLMTRAAAKGQGLAGRLVAASLRDLAGARHTEARAVITMGNEPSERLFTRLGFQQVTEG